VKALLDTSVLVPAFLADHPHHAASLDLLLRFGKAQTCCAAHSLAEFYATLTRLPGKERMTGDHAMLFLAEVRQYVTPVVLDEEEYYSAMERASVLGVRGGTIYDALLANCALKAKAETLFTWNIKHFQQFTFIAQVRTP
jgi:predicted nucleic acid-binding protein